MFFGGLRGKKQLLSPSAEIWNMGDICASSRIHFSGQLKLNQYTAISLITGGNKPTTKAGISNPSYICGQPYPNDMTLIKCRLVQLSGKRKKAIFSC